jgi:hypothetical protein
MTMADIAIIIAISGASHVELSESPMSRAEQYLASHAFASVRRSTR